MSNIHPHNHQSPFCVYFNKSIEIKRLPHTVHCKKLLTVVFKCLTQPLNVNLKVLPNPKVYQKLKNIYN